MGHRWPDPAVRDLTVEHAGNNTRLAADKIMVSGLRILEVRGLEDQVLITEDGFETLTTDPWDTALMGR